MKLDIRECTIDDLVALREISYRTYDDTFKNMNTPANMKDYLEKAFDIDKMHDELLNIDSQFYFLYADGELAGYLKLNEGPAQTDIRDPQSIEVERIYVLKEFHSKGLGSVLLNKAKDIAKEREKAYIWLGVWEKNDKAIQFYKRNGFYLIGQHYFFMGDDEQTDLIMRKDIEAN
ncbi:GNAT family N-acetyltransferase [Wukongibacter sp. M2B1]|uniref:GNAT family N-acetyltransferase n=1 Tax=Wukongibacter sp. M2B1 TaxID=3088895 RepID=UPI003D7B6504